MPHAEASERGSEIGIGEAVGVGIAERPVRDGVGEHSSFPVSDGGDPDVGSASAPGLHHVGAGQFVVSLEHRVGVDAELRREGSEWRERIAGRQVAASDGGVNGVCDPEVGGSPVVGRQFNVHGLT